MPRSCTVCTHPERPAIDGELVSGTSLRNIAEQFRLTVTSLHRHKHGHVSAALAKARDAQTVADAEGLLGQIQKLTAEAHRLKSKAEDKGDLRTALSAIRELVRMVELLAKLRGELDESPKVAWWRYKSGLWCNRPWSRTQRHARRWLGLWRRAMADLGRAMAATLDPSALARYVSRGRWRLARHLEVLNGHLVELSTGASGRLVVCMPPRHGKSELCSVYLPAWYLGTHPERRVILVGHEADFAASWGRRVRDVLEEHGGGLFGVGLRADSAAAHRWDITGYSGGMVTAGVGGTITGRGADLLIIDDPHKSAEEAGSVTYRERVWDWYRAVARTRLEPGAGVVVVQTRWHEDDLWRCSRKTSIGTGAP